jgi:hypothetical protein
MPTSIALYPKYADQIKPCEKKIRAKLNEEEGSAEILA